MSFPSEPTNQNPVPMPAPSGIPSDAEIRALAQQLNAMSTPDFTASALLKGTVISSNLTVQPSTASITLMGSSTQIDGVMIADNVTAVAGDVVNVTMQGNNIQITGRVSAGAGANGGWTQATLSSGFTHNGDSGGNVEYRLIQDNGAAKMQWRGVAAVAGSVTTVLSAALGTAYRPASQRKLLLARGMGNGAAILDVQAVFATSGTVTLAGNTYSLPGSSHTHEIFTSLDGYESAALSNLQHSHIGNDGVDSGGGATGSASGSAALSTPDWVSFNGVEYFL